MRIAIRLVIMVRKDFYLLGILWLIALLIFLPLFYSEYIYTDEVAEIWEYNTIPGHQMFTDDGRWLAEQMHSLLFKAIDTIQEVTRLRFISLFGWLLCLPVWYLVIKRLVANVPAYEYLPFVVCAYLITSLPFLISVQWAACMQFFIADTVALLSGTIALKCIQCQHDKPVKRIAAGLVSAGLGLASLFLYQSAYACFLIPFLLYFLNPFANRKEKVLVLGLTFHLVVCAVYFLLYKLTFSIYDNFSEPTRNSLFLQPVEKLKFFVARPLERSFRFTLLTNEENAISRLYYAVMLLMLVVLAFSRFQIKKWQLAVKYLAGIGCVWVISYLPPLLIREYYPSNRTLMALNLCVFIVCLEMGLWFIKNKRVLQICGIAMICFFTLCARYNFQKVFLRPIVDETAALKGYFKQHFTSSIQTIHFIQPLEDFVSKKYKVNWSMDELGVPSTFADWVPESLSKQLIYEATGNRQQAARVVVKRWSSKEDYLNAHEVLNSSILLVDVPAILNAEMPGKPVIKD
ncbi:MAG TPA: glucosyltransferase domain-containing protein [Niastella sp.]|nr:glucosyltransferase domain-containing protein [Niastella sp.]